MGPVMLTPGMTPLQAIVSAGGLTQFANSKHIYILRTVAGKQQKIPFNYKAALKGDNQGVLADSRGHDCRSMMKLMKIRFAVSALILTAGSISTVRLFLLAAQP